MTLSSSYVSTELYCDHVRSSLGTEVNNSRMHNSTLVASLLHAITTSKMVSKYMICKKDTEVFGLGGGEGPSYEPLNEVILTFISANFA